MIHYPVPIHKQEAYKEYSDMIGRLPIAESIADEILSLPIYPEISKDDIDKIIESINSYDK